METISSPAAPILVALDHPSYAGAAPVPMTMPAGPQVNVGATCPNCHARSYSTKYSLAHLFICLLLLPIGLLCLLFPVKRCNGCGHEYGLGRFLRSTVWFVVGLVVLAAMGIGIVIANGHSASTTRRSVAASVSSGTVVRNPLASAQEPQRPTPQPARTAASADDAQAGAVANESSRQENAIRAFYFDLSQKNYSGAYSLLSSRYHSGTSFDQFTDGYSTTTSVTAQTRARADGSENVDVILDAEDLKGGRIVQTRFVGFWHLVHAADGGWRLDGGKFTVDGRS